MTGIRKKKCFFLLLILCAITISAAAEPQRLILRIREHSGKVRLFRDGTILESLDISKDTDFGKYDLLETEAEGAVKIEIFSQAALGAEMLIGENTACYFDTESKGGKQSITLYLFTGQIHWTAKKMTDMGEITIQTEFLSSTLTGTDIVYTSSPDGSVLALCRDGKVLCINKRGSTLSAVPGNAIEQVRSGQLRSIPIELTDFERFIQEWRYQKLEAFKTVSLKNMKTSAVGYIEDLDRFNTAYVELMKYRDIFKRWSGIQKTDNLQAKDFAVRDKITTSPAVFKMRNVLSSFERTFYRILDFRNFYYDEKMEEGMIWPGYSTNDFFSEFTRHKADISWKMAQVRYILKLYAAMSWETSPGFDLF